MAEPTGRPLRRRLLWFIVLWAAGVLTVAAVAWILKLLLAL